MNININNWKIGLLVLVVWFLGLDCQLVRLGDLLTSLKQISQLTTFDTVFAKYLDTQKINNYVLFF